MRLVQAEKRRTYNSRISTSVRPAAAARAFCRLMRLWMLSWLSVNLGIAGKAEVKAARPAVIRPRVFVIEGMLSFLLTASWRVGLEVNG